MNKIGIYVHVPYCIKKCGYCDFYSVCDMSSANAYTDRVCELVKSNNRAADTLYFGGGTPSLLGADRICRIIDAASHTLDSNAEITLEVNPGDNLLSLLPQVKQAGVNRLSIGMQSHDDEVLSKLTRRHTAADVDRAIEVAFKSGIENVSLDVMLGVEAQTEHSLRKTLEFCISSGANHVSAYMLKVEPGTPFSETELNLPDEETTINMYRLTSDVLTGAGFEHYEISNFAKAGSRSRHNMKYWNCDEYLGIGPAAHSYMDGKRFYNVCDLQAFLSGTTPVDDGEGGTLDEYIMLRLRLSDGVSFSELAKRYSNESDRINQIIERAKQYIGMSLTYVDDEHMRLTEDGFLLSNMIISQILA